MDGVEPTFVYVMSAIFLPLADWIPGSRVGKSRLARTYR